MKSVLTPAPPAAILTGWRWQAERGKWLGRPLSPTAKRWQSAEEDVDRLAVELDVLVAELRVPVAELRVEDDEPALPLFMPPRSL